MINPDNTQLKYCLVNRHRHTQMWWKEIMLPKEYNLYVAFPCWVQFVRLLVFSEELRILNDIWIICSMNNAKVRASIIHGRPEFAARFSCHTWMFWCKDIVIGQVFVPHANVFVAKKLLSRMFVWHVLFQWNCVLKINISKKIEKKKLYPLRMITDPKECPTEIFRQICARTSKFFFNKQTHYSN